MLSPGATAHYLKFRVQPYLGIEAADNLVPAIAWGALTVAKLVYLAQNLLAGPSGVSGVSYASVVAQITATALFTGLIFGFFATRKPVLSRRASVTDRLVAFTGTLLPLVPVARNPDPNTPALLIISTIFVLLGIAIACVALCTLGRHFGIAPEVRGLVTTGIYRYVRHPIYLGEIIAVFGATLAAPSLPAVLIFVFFCLAQSRRAYLEERTLTAVFPAYRAYRIQTWRIAPGLW